MEELDERKTKILKAVIRNYLDTGEPVGSRTISKYTDLNLSSATIRNEMSDLEDLGYIVSPHTSAGRIPTDKGYRFYVDNLMMEKDREVSDMKEFVIEHTEKMEAVLKQVVKLLANNTNYATMITAPNAAHGKLKFIQLSAVDEEHILAVIVLDRNVIKNKMIAVMEKPDEEIMLKLNLLLNTHLNGMSLDQINLAVITRMKEQAGEYAGIVEGVLNAIAEAIGEDEDLEIYTSGATNIFKYPELSDSRKASELILALEEKTSLADLVTAETDDENDIQVYIGSESPVSTMKDCSVVTASYDLGDGMKGTIGIIGPKRMDYENVYDNLKTLKKQLDDIFRKDDT
ncbi:MAG: heat-inducible transcriptional repressor HrcA [Lachnospiraceae bacterium]|nr:heat-inducible transcriptional repressor HrcA [Lachnospiraceae bacterium]